MTGAVLCRRLLERAEIEVAVVRGPANHYVPGERLIVLRQHCYNGTSRKQLTWAAHEAGHAEQEHRYGWIAPAVRWTMPGRLLLEWDASRRARRMMREEGLEAHADALRESWEVYLVPALWQAGIMLVILGVWAVGKG
jgi:Zn-dependent membrane protease YugP